MGGATVAASSVEGETPQQQAKRMDWFSKAKLGIFIHWGPYSTGRTSESWAFHNGHVTLEDYMKQADEFTAANYDPDRSLAIVCKRHRQRSLGLYPATLSVCYRLMKPYGF